MYHRVEFLQMRPLVRTPIAASDIAGVVRRRCDHTGTPSRIPHGVQRQVSRYAVQQRRKFRLRRQTMQMPIQPDETFLREIFGVLRGSRHPVTKLHNTMLIPANKFGKGRLVARLGLCYRVPIRIVVHAFPLKSNTPTSKKFHIILRITLSPCKCTKRNPLPAPC